MAADHKPESSSTPDTLEHQRLTGVGFALRVLLLLALCFAHFLIVYDTLKQSTPTVDEVAHLPAGLSYVEKATFRMYPHNPPLVRVLCALAVSGNDLSVDYDTTWKKHNPPNHWEFATSFLMANASSEANQQQYLNAFTTARTLIAIWSALTIPFLFLWGRWWFGEASGWLAAAVWTLSPNVIAHAGFVTTDIAAASTGFIASYFFARWLSTITWKRATGVGILLGLAQLVKFSSLVLYLIWPIWLIIDHFVQRRIPGTSRKLSTALAQFAGMVAFSIFVINVGYRFEGTFTPLGDYPFISQTLTRPRMMGDPAPASTSNRAYNDVLLQRINRFSTSWLGMLPTPLPYYYVNGFDVQKFETEGLYQMYLRGQFASEIPTAGRTGWWYYYLYAMAVKIPISTHFLLILAVLRQCIGPRVSWYHWGVIFSLFAAPVAAMSLLTDINIGLRYTLGVFPYLFLLSGTALRVSDRWIWKWVAALLIVWNAFAIYRIHPHELSYFNEWVGGPKNGRFHLIDSNIDWGQDLRKLSRWLQDHPEWREAKIAYFGSVCPEFEGIQPYLLASRMLPENPQFWLPEEKQNDPQSYGPQPGKFIISVNFERGMFFHTPYPLEKLPELLRTKPHVCRPGKPMIYNDKNAFAFFQHFEPTIMPEVGYSLLFYDISLEEANHVRSLLKLPLINSASSK